MRKEEIVKIETEFTDKDGKVVQEWSKEYHIKASFENWLKATRADLLKKGIKVTDWKRWDRKKQEETQIDNKPKSKPLC
jgi:hypothetical protein